MASREDIVAFARRPWALLAEHDAEYWSAFRRRHGSAGVLRIADELRRDVIARRPDWPGEDERELDLRCHLRVSEALRRVPPATAELFRSLASALANRRWYVFGAQAAVSYGRPRLTADVDVTVESPKDPGKLLDELAAAGFPLRLPEFRQVLEQARVVPLVHQASGLPVDLVFAGPGLEEEFFARAREIDVGGGLRVPMISPEDLVASKLLAGRTKDLEDVVGVLAEQGERLDLERIREVLGALEGALDQSDLQPAFERLLAEARASRPGRPPTGRRTPKRR